jgi:hypothetical protein
MADTEVKRASKELIPSFIEKGRDSRSQPANI